MNDWIILAVIYAAVFISSPLIAVFHELGHALAYLVLTKPRKIDIYIGSYGSRKNVLRFNAGKLRFYVKKSFPFVWGIGLCRSYKAETDYKKYIVILLAGVVFTLVSAGIIALIAFTAHAHILVQIACYIFLGFSFLSLLGNLIPREIIGAYDNLLNSDGKQLIFALKIKNSLPGYIAATKSLRNKDYDGAVTELKAVLAAVPKNREILTLIIPLALESRRFDDAACAINILESMAPLSNDVMFYRGGLQSLTGRHDEAINTYSEVIRKDKNHILALTNIGYELVEKGAHQVAKRALDRAIKLKPTFPQPYANLAYSKIIQGELKEGKRLIDTCLELNEYIADAYKALGLYHLKLKDKANASANFEKAVALDATIDLTIHLEELASLQEQTSVAIFKTVSTNQPNTSAKS